MLTDESQGWGGGGLNKAVEYQLKKDKIKLSKERFKRELWCCKQNTIHYKIIFVPNLATSKKY